MKRLAPSRAVPLLFSVLALAASACLVRPDVSTSADQSPKLSRFVFFEEGTQLFIGVDGRAARYAEKENLIPLGIGLANVSSGTLTLSPESFTIEAADGSRYPVASVEEFNRDYGRSRADAKFAEPFIEQLSLRFRSFAFRRWTPFPVSGGSSVANHRIEFARRQWTHAYLYFPKPSTGVLGQEFSLLVNAQEIPETLVVSFTVR